MTRIAYVNGRYVRHAEAGVSIDDRAHNFGDGVYEAMEVSNGKLTDLERHLARLKRSLGVLRIAPPMGEPALKFVLRETVARNRVRNGMLYMQVSRGAAPRDHSFPPASVKASLIVVAKSIDPDSFVKLAARGASVITAPDERWAHPHIKTLQLLPNVLAKEAAHAAGAEEAWLVDAKGLVTEGSSSNAWIVSKDGVLITRHADNAILRGVTRTTLIDVAAEEGAKFEERSFSLDEALSAREAFYSNSTSVAMPVVAIDGKKIGDGKPGKLTLALRRRYQEMAART